MKLVIHDMSEEEWEKISDDYFHWKVLSQRRTIQPCVGCFGCWVKTPGQCVLNDDYANMGSLIHEAEEIVVISKYTYGGFSSYVKNVFDRCIGWLLPYFEVVNGETHHKKRYPEKKPMTFIFRGNGLTEEDKEKARRYVEAVCLNFRGIIKDIRFEECEDEIITKQSESNPVAQSHKVILLNGSVRGNEANSKKFLDRVAKEIEGAVESINLASYNNNYDKLLEKLSTADRLVLGLPMYVDGIPSALLRVMERIEKTDIGSGKKIYAVVNMGFYESSQIKNVLSSVKDWSDKCGFEYCGGLAIGAGGMMGTMSTVPSYVKCPAQNVVNGLEAIGMLVNTSQKTDDIYADAFKYPRFLYIKAANAGWHKYAEQYGLKKKDLKKRLG
ncbi:Flavodoxin-like fold [Pseudobutyrivibrio sp. 49]|uniref:NAD(P)H-dependent oxidoreductase n=1 Tax=Pseudobutyrivibrio sp. 49 TaxID=1855344 RepID=UPI00087DF5E7|nr:NAD(P)H-dependent oxidoreductase [Pseudobutyrivibrio sp. 49]SDI31023.1 Flavodoxin-like fold [Pseudobutyrivibrio sp. 49]